MARQFSHRRLARFIADEMVKGESNKRLAQAVAAYLQENGEVRSWELLFRDIETALEIHHGILSAEVTSARKLDESTLAKLREMLKLQKNVRDVQIVPQSDPSLLGGFILRTPQSEMNTSISRKLQELKRL